jgi:hypothetical protein
LRLSGKSHPGQSDNGHDQLAHVYLPLARATSYQS